MKQTLLLPVVCLFAFLCAAVALSTLCFFASWGRSWDGAEKPGAEMAIRQMPSSFQAVLVPSVLVGLIAAGMRSTRKPVHRLVLLPVALILSYALTVGGFLGLDALLSGTTAAGKPSERPLPARSFTQIGSSVLSAEKSAGADLQGVLVYSPDARGVRFRVFPAATVERSGDQVRVRVGKAGAALAEGRSDTAASEIFRADPIVEAFLSDLETLSGDFRLLVSSSFPEFLIAVFALLFALTASFVLLRITRWPLANLFLYILAVRAWFLLFRLLREDLGAGIASAFANPLLARLFPYGVFIAAGLLLLLVDLLFVPADGLREEAA